MEQQEAMDELKKAIAESWLFKQVEKLGIWLEPKLNRIPPRIWKTLDLVERIT